MEKRFENQIALKCIIRHMGLKSKGKMEKKMFILMIMIS